MIDEMATILCKMCGGRIEVSRGQTTCECPYCGTMQSVSQDKKPFSENGGNDGKMRRIYHFLADKNWERADNYCEKMLDENPENAEIYLLKTLAEFRCGNVEKLFGCLIQNSQNFAKAKRFAQGELRERILEIDEKSLKIRALRQFMNHGFYNQKTVPVSEKDCVAMLEKIGQFSKEDCAFWPEISKAKREIESTISADKMRAKEIEVLLRERDFLRALKVIEVVKLAEVLEVRERVWTGAYSQAMDLMNRGRKLEALEIFLKLPKDYSETQLRILECYIALENWRKVEEHFKFITVSNLRERKCQILLKAAREEEKKSFNLAHRYYALLADCGNAEAKVWIAKEKKREERSGCINLTWFLAFIFSAVALLNLSIDAKEDKAAALVALFVFLLVSSYPPINLLILWLKKRIDGEACILVSSIVFFIAAIVVVIALAIMFAR